MSNPARELYEQFEAWRGNGTLANDRQMGDGSGSSEAHRSAMRNLLDTERRMHDLGQRGVDVSNFRRYLQSSWTTALIGYPDWKGNSRNNPNQVSMDMLHSLALLFDREFDQVKIADTEIKDFLDQVMEALAEDDTIGDAMRWYIQKLVTDIRQTVDDHEFMDTFDLNDALQRLWASLQGAAHQSSEPKRWERLSEFIWTAASGAVGSIPALTVAAAQLMITA